MFGHGMARELRDTVTDRFSRADPALANWFDLVPLFDHAERVRILDANGISVQVLTTPSPPLETMFEGQELRDMIRLANDSMADLVATSGGRVRGTVTIPLCDPDFAIEEMRRGVRTLGLLGPQIFSSSLGMALDDARLEPFWAELEHLGTPAWMHPERRGSQADYPGEEASRFSVFLVFGWPYESSVAMARLVFSGVLERHPGLKIIVHHAGAMIPFFSNRIAHHYPEDETLGRIENPVLATPIIDGFKRFYVDTAIHGPVSALMCSYDFFGADHMMVGTDMPFGPRNGEVFCNAGAHLVDEMQISQDEQERIRTGTALSLCSFD